jgi:hypoxanthine phosphoribosyltransferase
VTYEFATEVISEAEVASRVTELGEAITSDYSGRDPLFVVVLKGSLPFGADLVREVEIPAEVDFIC